MFKKYFSYSGSPYIYDSETNSFFLLDKRTTSLVPAEGESSSIVKYYKEYNYAKNRDCINHVSFENRTPNILSVEVTQQCNLRCEYCIYSGKYIYERQHRNCDITDATFNAVLKRFFSSEKKTPEYVGFYGGEPLLCFDTINKFHDQITQISREVEFQITTNGTLFSEEIIQRLVRDNYHVTVSYDGLNHDLYRKTVSGFPTSKKVLQGLRSIQQYSQDFFDHNVRLQITLSPPYRLSEQASYFNNHELLKKMPMGIAFVNAYDTSFTSDKGSARNDLTNVFTAMAHDLYKNYENSPFQRALFQKFINAIDYRSMDPKKNPLPHGNCEFFLHRGFVDITGNCYPCERVGQLGCFGNILEDTDFSKRIRALHEEYDCLVQNNCNSCVISRFCSICSARCREGVKYNPARFKEQCAEEQKWFDIVVPLFLSLKEKGII